MTVMSGMAPRPWVKLWKDERGSFQQLPLFARALAAELLKLCDDHGVIAIGSREPVEAIAFALGADRSDRRLLKKYLPMLIDDGYVRRDGDRLVVCSWRKWQSKRGADPLEETPPVATAPLSMSNESTTTEQRIGHDRATTAPRPSNETGAKCSESRGRISQEEEGEGEEEGDPPNPPPASPPSEAVRSKFFEAWKTIRRDPPITRDRDTSGEVAAYLVAASERTGVAFDALLAGVMERYWREDWPRNLRNVPTFANLLGGLPRYVADTVEALGAEERKRRREVAPSRLFRYRCPHTDRPVVYDAETGEERYEDTGEVVAA